MQYLICYQSWTHVGLKLNLGYGIELWITVNQALHNWQWM